MTNEKTDRRLLCRLSICAWPSYGLQRCWTGTRPFVVLQEKIPYA
jgi:hypothetical protein